MINTVIQTYTIQEVSEKTRLPSSTLRYYEEMGLLEPVERAANGHRRYTDTDLNRINMLTKLRRTGMSIEQMRVFVTLYRSGASTAPQRIAILQAHRAAVQAQVDEVLEILKFIDYKIGLYQNEETKV